MSSEPPPDDPDEEPTYEVGYGKPPRATRFKPGRSGNPKGRPKGSRINRRGHAATEPWKAMLDEELYRRITVRDGDRQVEMPVMQAVIRRTTLAAVQGDHRSQRLLFATADTVASQRRREQLAFFATVSAYKIEGSRQIAHARASRLPPPELFPHPDHLIVDPIIGRVEVRGPMTPEEKSEWDEYIGLRQKLEKRSALLVEESRGAPLTQDKQDELASLRSVMARIDAALDSFNRVLLHFLD